MLMATVYRTVLGGRIGASVTADAYYPLRQGLNPNSNTTLADAEITFTVSGVLKNLRALVRTSSSSTTTNITVYLNGSPAALTMAISAAATGWHEDTTNDVVVAAGDRLAIFLDRGDAGAQTFDMVACDFLSETAVTIVGGYASGAGIATNSATRYGNAFTASQFTATSEDYTSLIPLVHPVAATLKNLGIYSISNARTTDTTVSSRLNGADGALSVTYGNVETGHKSDLVNSDDIAAGDITNLKVVTSTGGGTINLALVSTVVQNDTTGSVNCYIRQIGQGNNTTRYSPAMGLGGSFTAESQTVLKLRGSGTIRNLHVKPHSNTTTGDCDISLRLNGATQSLTVTVPAGSTALESDTTNSFTFADGDEINFITVRGASTGSATIDGSFEILYDAETYDFSGGSVTNPYYTLLLQSAGGMHV